MVIRSVKVLLAAAVVGAAGVSLAAPAGDPGAAAGPTYKIVANSDSQYAHEMLRLGQADLIKSLGENAKGSPAENLWKAQELVVTWDQIAKSRTDVIRATTQYVTVLNKYLDATPDGIDGIWAMDHAKFVFGQLSKSTLDRMEYFGSSPKDRAALAPMAALGERLLKQAQTSMDAAMRAAEAPGHAFDEANYMRNYNATSEVEYYTAWGQYFKAMSLEQGTKERKDLLNGAIAGLNKWADAEDDNGVNKQALLLRGKARSESGDLVKAVEDLNKASADGPGEVKSPDWVQYQSKYQVIVTRIRARDFTTANKELEDFKKGLPQGSVEAKMSTNMLGYRIAWAEAETKSGKEKTEAQVKAMAILAGIIKEDPRFRDLIYEQLSAQIPDGADLKTLMPMQQLAIAYGKSTGQKGDTPDSRAALQAAINAALEVRKNASSTPSEKLEGLYLAGLCSAVLNQLQDAVKYSIEFVSTAPKDPRSKDLLSVAMQQIGELRQVSQKTGTPLTPEMKDLVAQALALSTGQGDTRFLYAQARNLEDNAGGDEAKLQEAAKVYAKIPPEDKNYIDARYHLVAISTTRLSELTGKKASPEVIQEAANDLFKACTQFIALLDHPPKNMPAEFADQAKKYRTDILIVETATALNPAVKRPEEAIKRLDKLDEHLDALTDLQKSAVLRYRIEAYQMNGQTDKILPLLSGYAKATGQNPIAVFQGLAVSTVKDIEVAEKNDPEQAKRLADFVVKLFDPIIEQETKDGHKKNAFDLKQVKADMMVRAGDFKGAEELCKALEVEEPSDIRSFMTEARASYVKAQTSKEMKDYAYSQDFFSRILPRITPGVEAFWECWLRILECKEAQGGAGFKDDIKKTLSDLKASTSKFGGDQFKDQFAAMAAKYGAS